MSDNELRSLIRSIIVESSEITAGVSPEDLRFSMAADYDVAGLTKTLNEIAQNLRTVKGAVPKAPEFADFFEALAAVPVTVGGGGASDSAPQLIVTAPTEGAVIKGKVTINGVAVSGKFSQVRIEVGAGLSPTTEAPKTLKSGKFAVHTLQLSCRRADLASVVRFYQTISPRAPYIAINALSLQSDRGTSGTVTMVVTLSSLELITPVT